MTTDSSTSHACHRNTRETSRALPQGFGQLWEGNPSSAGDQREIGDGNSNTRVSFAGQSHFDSNQDGDTDVQASGLEASMRKRSAKTDARRLEAERFELDERSQKRKAEGPSLDCLAEWHREDEPHDEIDSLLQQRDRLAIVHQSRTDRPMRTQDTFPIR